MKKINLTNGKHIFMNEQIMKGDVGQNVQVMTFYDERNNEVIFDDFESFLSVQDKKSIFNL